MKAYKRILALLLAALMAIFCGACTAQVGQTSTPARTAAPDLPDDTVLFTMNGMEYTLGQYRRGYDQMIEYYKNNYGVDYTAEENAADHENLKRALLSDVIQLYAEDFKITELGLDRFTDEELASMRAEAEVQFDKYRADFYSQFEAAGATKEDGIDTLVQSVLDQYGISVDGILESMKSDAAREKLQDYISYDITIDDADIDSYYSHYHDLIKGYVGENPKMFAAYWNQDVVMVYCPGGYSAYVWVDYDNREDAEAALGRINAGTAIKDVLAETGSNEYYDAETIPQGIGFVLYEQSDVDAELLKAALGLKAVGDVSGVIKGGDGLFYIVEKTADIVEHDMDKDEFFTEYEEIIRSDKLEHVYENTVSDWAEEYGLSIDYDKLVP